MESPMTAADVGAVLNGRGGGWGGDGLYGIIGLLAVCGLFNGGFGGFGGWGNRGGGDCLTTAESCNMNSFNELKSQVGRMNDMMFTNARQQDNATCTLGYQAAEHANQTQRLIEGCCCDLKTAIHAEGEATRAMIQENKIESLQHEVSDLKTAQLFCGIPRLPQQFTYAVPSPFNNGCCNNGNRCNTLF